MIIKFLLGDVTKVHVLESMLDEEDSTNAFIWRQYPEYDEFRRLNMGMEVDIWLSIDSTLLPVPDSALIGEDTEIVHE